MNIYCYLDRSISRMKAIEKHRQKESTPSISLDQDGVKRKPSFAVSKESQRRSGSQQQTLVSLQDRYETDSAACSTTPLNMCSIPSLISVTGRSNNVSAYECVWKVEGHDGCIHSMAFAEESNLLYSGSIGKDIRVCGESDQSGELVEYCRFGCEGGAVKSILVAQDKIFSAHQDHKIRVWKRSKAPQDSALHHMLKCTIPTLKDYLLNSMLPKNYIQVRRHKHCLWIQHVDTISALALKDGNLYSASWDRTVKVWRLPDFRCIESIRAHSDAINALVVSSGGFLYTASADSTIKVWTKYPDNKKHSLVKVIDRHKHAVNALSLSPDGLLLYSGGGDSSVFVWEVDKMVDGVNISVTGELRGHRQPVLCLATVSDIVCYGSADMNIRVWRREAGSFHSCLAVLEGHTAPVKCITALIDELVNCVMIYTGSLNGEIRAWRILHPAVAYLTSSSQRSE